MEEQAMTFREREKESIIVSWLATVKTEKDLKLYAIIN